MDQQNIVVNNGSSTGKFQRIASMVIWGLVVLVPLFFIPISSMPLHASKMALLTIAFVVLLVMFLSSVLSSGIIEFPKSRFLIPLVALALIALVSSVFSGAIIDSIAGEIFESTTSGTLLILVGLVFLIILNVGSKESIIKKSIDLFLLSAYAFSAFIILRAFVLEDLPVSIGSKIPNFLNGTGIDVAVFLGASLIASLSILNSRELSKRNRYLLIALSIFSMLCIGAVNLVPVIITVGLLALVYFVYVLSWSVSKDANLEEQRGRKVSLTSLFVIVASVIFLISGNSLSSFLSNTLKINTIEVRPSFEATIDLTKSALGKNPALGVGPNRFTSLWNMNKPLEVNLTQFWNTPFAFGYGFIPTLTIVTGLLGLLAFLAFIFLYVSVGMKAIFVSGDSESRYAATTTFLVSMYFWVIFFVHMPSIANFALAFIFTALFTSSLVARGVVNVSRINIFSNPKTNFITILAIVVFILLSISGGYFVMERIVASSLFSQGLQLAQVGNTTDAKQKVLQAVSVAPVSSYWRGISELSMAEANTLVAKEGQNLSEASAATLRGLIADSVESGRRAIEADSGNYENWFSLARIYETLGASGIEGSLENAKANYLEAQKRAPSNPAIELGLARVAALSGDTTLAREAIGKAINLKRNYTDAYFLLAQIEAGENNIPAAIRSVEAATLIDSQNAGLYFQLGLLKYNQNDFRGAASAFTSAVTLVTDYANARYFLGLSKYFLGDRAGSIEQFEAIMKTNPGNQEITLILENLKDGKKPFADAKPPLDDKPEDREEPPIEE
ncbi:MAG: tetratricopeptide repeat protein [Patescibacteria group bacterium]